MDFLSRLFLCHSPLGLCSIGGKGWDEFVGVYLEHLAASLKRRGGRRGSLMNLITSYSSSFIIFFSSSNHCFHLFSTFSLLIYVSAKLDKQRIMPRLAFHNFYRNYSRHNSDLDSPSLSRLNRSQLLASISAKINNLSSNLSSSLPPFISNFSNAFTYTSFLCFPSRRPRFCNSCNTIRKWPHSSVTMGANSCNKLIFI